MNAKLGTASTVQTHEYKAHERRNNQESRDEEVEQLTDPAAQRAGWRDYPQQHPYDCGYGEEHQDASCDAALLLHHRNLSNGMSFPELLKLKEADVGSPLLSHGQEPW